MLRTDETKLILLGKYVQLEPITPAHHDDLCRTAAYEHIWTYMPEKPMGENFTPWFEHILLQAETNEQITYVARHIADNKIVGSTAYYDIDWQHKRLTFGYSWYMPSVWGKALTHEARLLMLTQVFENWDIDRVEIGTDSRNLHSYNAIKNYGATEEGLLRSHMIQHDGIVTDTIVFSILSQEWPKVKTKLMERLKRS